MDALLRKLKERFPEADLSTPFVIDEDGPTPFLVATWRDLRPTVTPQVDFIILTKKQQANKWPSIVGYITLDKLQTLFPQKVLKITLEDTCFYSISNLDDNELKILKTYLTPGLPQKPA
ncbi:MAG: hypothetical protein RMM17_09795 [Acidobacteriota bacterium]|nr:hypothetical protein [Blastocatellia bacterium]MDW8412960.1 hypothetical protein [Acidobacteriota bacterium]